MDITIEQFDSIFSLRNVDTTDYNKYVIPIPKNMENAERYVTNCITGSIYLLIKDDIAYIIAKNDVGVISPNVVPVT